MNDSVEKDINKGRSSVREGNSEEGGEGVMRGGIWGGRMNEGRRPEGRNGRCQFFICLHKIYY